MEVVAFETSLYFPILVWCNRNKKKVYLKAKIEGVEQFAIRSVNLLHLFGIKRNCLRSGRSRSLYLSIRRGIKQIVITVGAYHFCQLLIKFCPTSFSQG